MSHDKKGIYTRIAFAMGAKKGSSGDGTYTGKWAEFESIVMDHFELAHTDAADHRHIGPTQILHLKEVLLRPESPSMQTLCAEFMEEFSQSIRVAWIQRIWQEALNNGIDHSSLEDVRLATTSDATPEVAKKADPHEQALKGDETDAMSVGFQGEWRDVTSKVVPKPRTPEPHATLYIRDASQQPKVLNVFDKPLVIGKVLGDEGVTVAVVGKYVSTPHAHIYWERGKLLIRDVSRNGTWVGDTKLKQDQPTVLHDKAEIRLAAPEHDASYGNEDCPRITLTLHHTQGGAM